MLGVVGTGEDCVVGAEEDGHQRDAWGGGGAGWEEEGEDGEGVERAVGEVGGLACGGRSDTVRYG